MIITSAEFSCKKVRPMIIKSRTQLAELIEDALSNVANLSKSFRTLIIETMELYLTSSGRMNFTQMARRGRSCESRFRQNFKKSFDWMTFNKYFVNTMSKDRIAIHADKKRQTRKVFFSTDLTKSAKDIFDIYRTRFQLEFVYRDGKQFMGLTHCQARNKEAMSFAFNASLSSVNVTRATHVRKDTIFQ